MLWCKDNFEEFYDAAMKQLPIEIVKYFANFWYPMKTKWVFQFRKDIAMYKRSNTNMLIESFHNTLKTRFFSGKINRRADRLI